MATVLLFVKSLFEVKRKRTRAFWEFNVCSLWFEHAQLFHISHFTYHLRYYMIMDYCRAVNNALTSYIRLCNLYYIKPNRTNQSCSPSKISQSINVEWRICDREMVKQFFSESKKNFRRLIKWESNIFPLDFNKYLSFLEVQKTSKVHIRKKEVCSKYVIKTLYGSKFLVSQYIFKLVYHCEGSRNC